MSDTKAHLYNFQILGFISHQRNVQSGNTDVPLTVFTSEKKVVCQTTFAAAWTTDAGDYLHLEAFSVSWI